MARLTGNGGFSDYSGIFPRKNTMPSCKGCIHTAAMMPEHIYAWTAWAHTIGVRYDGKWGYHFPKDPEGQIKDKILRLGRGRDSRHKKREKGRIPPFANPIEVRKVPSKVLRRTWYRTARNTPFREWMSSAKRTEKFVNNTNIRIGGRAELALRAIYQRVEKVDLPRPLPLPREKRPDFRARLTQHHEATLEMTRRASYEMQQRLRYIQAQGLNMRSMTLSKVAYYDRATDILGCLKPRMIPRGGGSDILTKCAIVYWIKIIYKKLRDSEEFLETFNSLNDRLQAELEKLVHACALVDVRLNYQTGVLILDRGEAPQVEVPETYNLLARGAKVALCSCHGMNHPRSHDL
jgi:hypothetical protein